MAYHLVKYNPALNSRTAPAMFVPGSLCTWRSNNPLPKGYQAGDKIIYWESGAGSRAVVALGVAYSDPVRTGRESLFDLLPTTGYKVTSLTQELLRGDPLFEGASFLKAAVSATVYPLSEEQGEFLFQKASEELSGTFTIEGGEVRTFVEGNEGNALGTLVNGLVEGPLSLRYCDGTIVVSNHRSGRGWEHSRQIDSDGSCVLYDSIPLCISGDEVLFRSISSLKGKVLHGYPADQVLMDLCLLLMDDGLLPTVFSKEVPPGAETLCPNNT